MKKAKIFLTALTVLTVVGGALAFKARTNQVFYTCDLAAKQCIVPFTTTLQTTTTENPLVEPVPYDKKFEPCNDGIPSHICQTWTTFNP